MRSKAGERWSLDELRRPAVSQLGTNKYENLKAELKVGVGNLTQSTVYEIGLIQFYLVGVSPGVAEKRAAAVSVTLCDVSAQLALWLWHFDTIAVRNLSRKSSGSS